MLNPVKSIGDILSPMLFNALECALRKWKGKCEHGIAMDHHERLTNIRYADDLMLYARSLPALVEMIETLSWELHQIGLQLNAAKSKIFTTKPLDHPMYVEVSQDLVHVLHEGSFFGPFTQVSWQTHPWERETAWPCGIHHRKTIAGQNSTNIGPYIQTNTYCKFEIAIEVLQCCCHASRAFQFSYVGIDESAIRKHQCIAASMLRSIVGWVRVNGEDWSETMRRTNHRLSVALKLFPIPPWTEQLAKRQFQFVATVASEQSWPSIVGHWTLPSRKRGRPLVKWDDKLSNITNQFFPLHHGWIATAKLPFWQNASQFFSHLMDF